MLSLSSRPSSGVERVSDDSDGVPRFDVRATGGSGLPFQTSRVGARSLEPCSLQYSVLQAPPDRWACSHSKCALHRSRPRSCVAALVILARFAFAAPALEMSYECLALCCWST